MASASSSDISMDEQNRTSPLPIVHSEGVCRGDVSPVGLVENDSDVDADLAGNTGEVAVVTRYGQSRHRSVNLSSLAGELSCVSNNFFAATKH